MIPLSVDVPMRRLPWANWALILATVVISLAVPYESKEDVSLPSAEDLQKPGAIDSLHSKVTSPRGGKGVGTCRSVVDRRDTESRKGCAPR
jgi:hypothetical protein